MTVVVIEPPSELLVDLETVKRSLAADADELNDDDVERLIKAAIAQIDGPAGWVGRAFEPQILELRLDDFCDEIPLPCPPCIVVVSVKYDDGDGVEQTLDPANYRVIGGDRPKLVRTKGGTYPAPSGEAECVRIQYEAGYGNGNDVPANAQEAVIVMVKAAHDLGVRNLFISSESTEGVGSTSYVVTENATTVMRQAAERLLQNLIVYR